MLTKHVVYLDVETDWSRRLTVVGFRSKQTGLVQLVDKEINRTRLLRELPKIGQLITFNGHCFDLACIRNQLDVDLRERFESIDLRWVCRQNGLAGGQKSIETQLGVKRRMKELNGLDAIRLWESYKRGDAKALPQLLCYNAEDVAGLIAIRRYLRRIGGLET